MQLIKTYKTTAVIEGLTKAVVVSIEVDNDDLHTEYMDDDVASKAEADIENGLIYCYWINVTARFSDLSHYEGSDSLGQVFVKKGETLNDVLVATVKEYDLVTNAIEGLIKNVLEGQNELNKFLGKAA